jgi:hypothetical protein
MTPGNADAFMVRGNDGKKDTTIRLICQKGLSISSLHVL